jgi:hypothetical protein
MANCFTPQATISTKQFIIPSWNEKGSIPSPVFCMAIFDAPFCVIAMATKYTKVVIPAKAGTYSRMDRVSGDPGLRRDDRRLSIKPPD